MAILTNFNLYMCVSIFTNIFINVYIYIYVTWAPIWGLNKRHTNYSKYGVGRLSKDIVADWYLKEYEGGSPEVSSH
jgi:hypothetical protein